MEAFKEYLGQEFEEINLLGLKRKLPLYNVEKNLWILANEALCFGCDIEFTRKVGKKLAERIAPFKPDILLAPEAKSLGLAFCIAENLGHKEFAIARKNSKLLTKGALKVEIQSITTPESQFLCLDHINREKIEGKRIVLFDDVISSGGTIKGLMKLSKKAGAEVVVVSTVWIEGKAVKEDLIQGELNDKLVYLDILPIYSKNNAKKFAKI
ncbi:MAG: hypothetical protein HQK84_09975 [Nitrospinae bacterium]|nr:hypothetical protein [Nitrospinota bacterium]